MTKNEFSDVITEKLKDRLGDDYEVKENSVLKNNGILMKGISVLKKGSPAAPNLYIDAFYERYERGIGIDVLTDEILSLYMENSELPIGSCDALKDFESAKNGMVYRLVNFEKNREMLKDSVYVPFMDLAMVVYYLFSSDKWRNMSASVRIDNAMLERWKAGRDEVISAAQKNTPVLLPVTTRSIGSVIEKYLGKRGFEGVSYDMTMQIPMYIMTNETGVNGASVMAYPDVLHEFAKEFKKSIYIIPSSIHEIILIPEDHGFPELNDFISEVNRNHLDPVEVLSDHAYFYDYEERKLLSIE